MRPDRVSPVNLRRHPRARRRRPRRSWPPSSACGFNYPTDQRQQHHRRQPTPRRHRRRPERRRGRASRRTPAPSSRPSSTPATTKAISLHVHRRATAPPIAPGRRRRRSPISRQQPGQPRRRAAASRSAATFALGQFVTLHAHTSTTARPRRLQRPGRRRRRPVGRASTSLDAVPRRDRRRPPETPSSPSAPRADMTHTLVLLRHGESDVERREPLHRLGRRRPHRQGPGRGAARRRAAARRRDPARRRPHLAAAPRDHHRRDRARRRRPALDPGPPQLAAQRAPLRRPPGQEQEADPRGVRRGAVHALAPLVRRTAAADRRRRRVLPGRTTCGTPTSAPSCPAPSASRTSSPGCCPTGTAAIADDLRAGQTVLVAAHGNSLRGDRQAPRRHQRRRHRRAQHPDRDAAGLRARRRPAARPVSGGRYLDPEAAAEAAAAVANQGR